jgi:hypothetical protein
MVAVSDFTIAGEAAVSVGGLQFHDTVFVIEKKGARSTYR